MSEQMSEQTTKITSNNEYIESITEIIKSYMNDNDTNPQKIDFQFISIMILYYIAKEEQIVDSIYSNGEIVGYDSSSSIIPEYDVNVLAYLMQNINLNVKKQDGTEYNFNSLLDYINQIKKPVMNNIGVKITVEKDKAELNAEDEEALKKIVWVIHKIRDSFVHIANIRYENGTQSNENEARSDSSEISYSSYGISLYNVIPYDKAIFTCDISYKVLLAMVNELNNIINLNKSLNSDEEKTNQEQQSVNSTSSKKLNESLLKELAKYYESYKAISEKHSIKYDSSIEKESEQKISYDSIDKKMSTPSIYSDDKKSYIDGIISRKYKINYVDSIIAKTVNEMSDIKRKQYEHKELKNYQINDSIYGILLKQDETEWIPKLFMQEISKKIKIDEKNMLLISFFNTFFSLYDNYIKECNPKLNISSIIDIFKDLDFVSSSGKLKQNIEMLKTILIYYQKNIDLKELQNGLDKKIISRQTEIERLKKLIKDEQGLQILAIKRILDNNIININNNINNNIKTLLELESNAYASGGVDYDTIINLTTEIESEILEITSQYKDEIEKEKKKIISEIGIKIQKLGRENQNDKNAIVEISNLDNFIKSTGGSISSVLRKVCCEVLTKIRNSLMHYNWVIDEKENTNIITFTDKTKKLTKNGDYIDDISFQCRIDMSTLYNILKNLINKQNNSTLRIDEYLTSEAIESIIANLKGSNNNNQEQLNSMLRDHNAINNSQEQNKKTSLV